MRPKPSQSWFRTWIDQVLDMRNSRSTIAEVAPFAEIQRPLLVLWQDLIDYVVGASCLHQR